MFVLTFFGNTIAGIEIMKKNHFLEYSDPIFYKDIIINVTMSFFDCIGGFDCAISCAWHIRSLHMWMSPRGEG